MNGAALSVASLGAAPARADPVPEGGAALLLVGHGSESVAAAGNGLLAHADLIRAAGGFRAVEAGFLNGAPTVEQALAALGRGPVYVVPCFMGEGYFTTVAIPRRLDRALAEIGASDLALRVCAPVGRDPGLADLLASRAERACAAAGLAPDRTVLLLVGHGNPRSSDSSQLLRGHAERLGREGRFGAVEVAFLEEEPLLDDALVRTRGRDVAAIGVLAGEGKHTVEDVPGLIAAERARRRAAGEPARLIDAGAVGPDPAMVELILRQVRAWEMSRTASDA